MIGMKIISLHAPAAEIIYALGAGDQIVGISHECDYPPEVKSKPIVADTTINSDQSSLNIDTAVSNALRTGQDIYKVDNRLFASLNPELVITQELCEVCAITPTDIQAAIRDCKPVPELLSLHPHSITEILEDIVKVGKAIGKEEEANIYVRTLQRRIENIHTRTKDVGLRPRVYCMEWLEPPYNAGHWVPEMVEIAGGRDALSAKGADSVRILWQRIVDYDPEVLVLMPCGFSIERTRKELPEIAGRPEWRQLTAVRANQVYLVNGPAYFNCSGPRIVDGVELLATILHPELSSYKFKSQDFQKYEISR